MKDCYYHAREVAKKFGAQYPNIGEILSNAAWCVRKADSELSADWRWTPTEEALGVLVLTGPAPDKLHHCGIIVQLEPLLVEHSLRGRVFTHSLMELARMGYQHYKFLSYRTAE